LDVPVIEELSTSVAVMVWTGGDQNSERVAVNVPTPLVSVLAGGSTAAYPLLVKPTVPL